MDHEEAIVYIDNQIMGERYLRVNMLLGEMIEAITGKMAWIEVGVFTAIWNIYTFKRLKNLINPEGFFTASFKRIKQLTTISEHHTRESIKILCSIEILEKVDMGMPKKVFYRVNAITLAKLYKDFINNYKKSNEINRSQKYRPHEVRTADLMESEPLTSLYNKINFNKIKKDSKESLNSILRIEKQKVSKFFSKAKLKPKNKPVYRKTNKPIEDDTELIDLLNKWPSYTDFHIYKYIRYEPFRKIMRDLKKRNVDPEPEAVVEIINYWNSFHKPNGVRRTLPRIKKVTSDVIYYCQMIITWLLHHENYSIEEIKKAILNYYKIAPVYLGKIDALHKFVVFQSNTFHNCINNKIDHYFGKKGKNVEDLSTEEIKNLARKQYIKEYGYEPSDDELLSQIHIMTTPDVIRIDETEEERRGEAGNENYDDYDD